MSNNYKFNELLRLVSNRLSKIFRRSVPFVLVYLDEDTGEHHLLTNMTRTDQRAALLQRMAQLEINGTGIKREIGEGPERYQ